MAMASGSVIKAAAKATSVGLVNSPRLIRRVILENPFSAARDSTVASRSVGAISVKPINTTVEIVNSHEKLEDWEFADYDHEETIISPIDNHHLTTPVFLGIPPPPPPTVEETIVAATDELKLDDFETSNNDHNLTTVLGTPRLTVAETIAAMYEVNDAFENAIEIETPTNDQISPGLSTPPTFEEAIVATGELKDALETIFVCWPRSDGSLQESIHSSQQSQINEYENALSPASSTASTPSHAIQAFNLLDRSPEVQGVVASIASDPSVWEAVLQNSSVLAYIQSHTTCTDRPASVEEEESKNEESEEVSSESDKKKIELKRIWKKIENGVIDMMSSVSEYFNTFFGDGGDVKKEETTIRDTIISPAVLGPSMMGVIVLVIIVVVLKRS